MRTIRRWGFVPLLCFLAGAGLQGAEAQARRAVLDRGNVWVTGIPVLGDGGFSALYGEYRLDLPAESAGGAGDSAQAPRCRIWLTGESLPLGGASWQPRMQIAGVPVFQRQDGEELLAAFAFSGGAGLGSWTAVFQFPQGLAAAGLDDPGANALLGRWLNRFLYFFPLIMNPSDLSLPAVIAF
ncbi:MAG: hypothetical protein LBO65_01405 [Spirochaetaceae bacterium]|nr:hypothetical protein [Spirochaetaceae bacterium]